MFLKDDLRDARIIQDRLEVEGLVCDLVRNTALQLLELVPPTRRLADSKPRTNSKDTRFSDGDLLRGTASVDEELLRRNE